MLSVLLVFNSKKAGRIQGGGASGAEAPTRSKNADLRRLRRRRAAFFDQNGALRRPSAAEGAVLKGFAGAENHF